MVRVVAAGLVVLLLSIGPAWADQARFIGLGRLFTNDYLGDRQDRWQSGSYVHSFVAGQVFDGVQPFGTLREYRLRSAIIGSDNNGPSPGDRPYAGTLSVGLHAHYGRGSTQTRVGADLTVLGPQTRLSSFQSRVHETLGLPQVRFTDRQLDNDFVFGVSTETAELIPVVTGVAARPFGEVLVGPEDIIRVGADVVIGGGLADDLLIRDVTTGQLYTGIADQTNAGFSFVFGADTALAADSIFLPGGDLAAASDRRDRVRAGVHWHGETGTSLFYGLTYLGPEYEGQAQGQVTGSVKLDFNF